MRSSPSRPFDHQLPSISNQIIHSPSKLCGIHDAPINVDPTSLQAVEKQQRKRPVIPHLRAAALAATMPSITQVREAASWAWTTDLIALRTTPMSQDTLVIKEFLTRLGSKETWRIDWLGNVMRRQGHMAQHHVQVFLSPLVRGYQGCLTDPGASDQTRQELVEVGVGYMPLLFIGATFRAGQFVPQHPRMYRRVYAASTVDPSVSRFVRLDECVTRDMDQRPPVSLVYPSEFSVGARAWPRAKASQVLAIPDAKGIDPYYLLIPCIEVIRFFFCTSSLFSTHLFSNAWSDLIWEKGCSTDDLPHSVTVGSNPINGLDVNDHKYLAFMLTSAKTKSAVQQIFQTLQATRVDPGFGPALQCPFPFDEHTRIEADVIPIQTGTKLGGRNFVTRLHHCSRPIPFEICYANPILNPNQGKNHDSPDLIPMNVGLGQRENLGGEGVGKVPVLTNVEAIERSGLTGDDFGNPGNFEQQITYRCDEDRFEGLRDIAVTRATKEAQSHRYQASQKGGSIPIQVEQASTANAEPGSRPVLSNQIRTDEDENSECASWTIKLLLDCVDHLRKHGYKVSALPLLRLTPQPQSRRTHRAWTSIPVNSETEGPPKYRLRVLVCLLVEVDERTIVIADIERRRGATSEDSFALAGFLTSASSTSEAVVEKLAELVSERKGWPMEDPDDSQDTGVNVPWVKMIKTPHNKDDEPKDLAQRIISFLICPLMTKAA